MASGSFVGEFAGTALPRIAAAMGAGFLLFDMEHGFLEPRGLRDSIAMCRASGIVPVVRVARVDATLVQGALEMGALGILAPTVESAAQARSLVEMCHYPPLGRRGAAFGTAHDDYRPQPVAEATAHANASIAILCMIESVAGIEAVEEIAGVEGIDGLWFGYIDYSLSAGVPGDLASTIVRSAQARMVAAAKSAGKAAAIGVASEAALDDALRAGFDVIAWGSDVHFIRSGLQAGMEAIAKRTSGAM